MKDLIFQLIKLFAGGAKNADAESSIKDIAGDSVKAVAGGYVKSLLLPVISVIAVIILLIAGWFILKHYNFTIFGIRFGGELKIENTANVVEKIKSISEFTTACYYEEAVLKNSKVEEGKQNKLMSLVKIEADSVRSEVVILAKGTVRAGYNLSKIPAEQIKVGGDSISVVLPKPEVFDVIINPSDYEMYVEDGKWSHEEISALQAEYRQALVVSSLESGLLDRADKVGKDRLEMFFKALGFSYVELIKANE